MGSVRPRCTGRWSPMDTPIQRRIGRSRQRAGRLGIPIAATLDMHANVSAALVGMGVMRFGFKTYPHIDMYYAAVAAETMTRVIQEGVRLAPDMFIRVPALLPSINMRTDAGPMKDLVVASQETERRPNIVAASVFVGFPAPTLRSRAPASSCWVRLAPTSPTLLRSWQNRFGPAARTFSSICPTSPKRLTSLGMGARTDQLCWPTSLTTRSSGGSADTTALIRAVIEAELNPRSRVRSATGTSLTKSVPRVAAPN